MSTKRVCNFFKSITCQIVGLLRVSKGLFPLQLCIIGLWQVAVVSGISESVHLPYPDAEFRNFFAYKGNPNFCIFVLVITLMITISCSNVNFNTIKAKVKK